MTEREIEEKNKMIAMTYFAEEIRYGRILIKSWN